MVNNYEKKIELNIIYFLRFIKREKIRHIIN
jgi:hypothetical protein